MQNRQNCLRLSNLVKQVDHRVILFLIARLATNLIIETIPDSELSKEEYAGKTVVYFIISSLTISTVYALNLSNIGILIFGIGTILNTLAIVANRGLMPVKLQSLKRLGLDESFLLDSKRHVPMNDSTKFNFLGDRFGTRVCSIGDIILIAGSIVIFYQALFLSFRFIFG